MTAEDGISFRQERDGFLKHIAIVEDEEMMREELAGILKKAGYLVSELMEFTNATERLLDELMALDLGADEYLTKPCGKERLLARISNVLKRFEGRSNLLEGRGVLLNRQTYTLYIHNDSVVLPKNQGKILEAFLAEGESVIG